jgi:glutathione synthase/RimK-type ligase-like ATP-grasp enzyme
MWVKFEVISSDRGLIYLPDSLSDKIDQNATIKFGGCVCENATILYTDVIEPSEGSSYDNPVKIRISNKLSKQLLLPESLVYQVKITKSCIFIGPVIGLLLGIHTQRYSPKHMQKYSDRFGIYDKIGGLIFAFSPKSVNWEKHTAFGLFYNIATTEWEYGCFPLPEVIYRRDFHSNPADIKKLIRYTGGRLFNSYRFTKMDLYNYLISDEKSKKYLPPTELSQSFAQVSRFIEQYPKVILKPIDLSRGRGICVIEKTNFDYKITDYRCKYPITSIIHGHGALENYFKLNQGFFNKYLIQRYLNLARINDSLFDIRVVMQKHKGQVWGCTGIECRVSSKNSHITNISRGGYALTLKEALQKSFKEGYDAIPTKINNFCQDFCKQMDKMNHHFAEFGMDIAVDVNQNIWLIEANVFPSFKGFKSMDRKTYLSIRHTPMLYALSLTKFGE